MWLLTVREPGGIPNEYRLKTGRNTIGRKPDNDIALQDVSASRLHAVVNFDDKADSVILYDLGSTNGTFVNRQRINSPLTLQTNDVIRIGGSLISVAFKNPLDQSESFFGTHRYTRELLLESLDHHAVLMYEVAHQLNTVTDLDSALNKVSSLMKQFMGADKGEVILAENFNRFSDLGFPTSIAKTTIEQRSAVVIPDMQAVASTEVGGSAVLLRIRSILCVPVISGEEVIGMIYMYKTDPSARPFDNRDMQLAVAISHQAALTIQRMILIGKINEEQKMRQLLQRFLSPQEAEYFLQDYLVAGRLPGLQVEEITVLFTDIVASTSLAERIGAHDFGEILTQYYQDVTNIVFKHKGLVKYLGDGVMAIFGMNESEDDAEKRAVLTGLGILDLVDSKGYAGGELMNIGVGVNTGKAMAGYVGTEQRVELTVLGDAVNVAHRLQNQARPNRLLVGPITAKAIADDFTLHSLGTVLVRGRTKPLQIHEVIRSSHN